MGRRHELRARFSDRCRLWRRLPWAGCFADRDQKVCRGGPGAEGGREASADESVAHYNLATAYSRTGKKAEADKEFAIHRQMTQKEPPPDDKAQQNPN